METALPEPELSPIEGDNKEWELKHDLSIEVEGYNITVKKGFKTDGESIPSACWFITGHPFQGEGMAAAIVHDALYGSELLPRAKCDLIFKKLLERYGVSSFRAMMRYRFLRLFGWITWSTHTDETRADAQRFVTITPPSLIKGRHDSQLIATSLNTILK